MTLIRDEGWPGRRATGREDRGRNRGDSRETCTRVEEDPSADGEAPFRESGNRALHVVRPPRRARRSDSCRSARVSFPAGDREPTACPSPRFPPYLSSEGGLTDLGPARFVVYSLRARSVELSPTGFDDLKSRRDYPLNLSILLSGGKETNQDFLSSGERTGKSPAPNPAVPPQGNVVRRVRLSRGVASRPSPS
ncbi:hypothetical protein P5V15_015473 [Pogonomyrmex californicus]